MATRQYQMADQGRQALQIEADNILMEPAIHDVIADRSTWTNENREAGRLRGLMQQLGCLVYGAGGYGRQVVASLLGHGYPVKGFIDANGKPGHTLDGQPVLNREMIAPEQAAVTVLVIAINNFKTPVDEVSGWARNTGFAELVYVPELPDLVDPGLGNYWQAGRSLMADQAEELARFEALLSDGRSRSILRQLVSYRISGQPEDHPPVDRDRQYFPADLPLPHSEIAVIDCGAFPGDLLETADKAGVHLANWYTFEPDRANFRHLGQFIQSRLDDIGEAVLFPCGVGSETGVIGFSAGQADASRAVDAASGDNVDIVPVVRVDDVLKLDRLDMVKLDIEGFEAGALDGMAGLLERHRPRIAIAIYHKPADLWELPLKINAMLPGGRYALRQHGYNGYDTVLYVDWA